MKNVRISIIILSTLLYTLNSFAQDKVRNAKWCVTDQETEKIRVENPTLFRQAEIRSQQMRRNIDNHMENSSNPETSPYIIPVVFHCITDGNENYVSNADVEDVLLTLNEDFQRMNADASNTRSLFVPYAMSMNIQFRLAHIDPNGNCTNGIVRLDSPLSTSCSPRNAVKAVSYWNSSNYFNIWVVNNINPSGTGLGAIAGYAQFPNSINATYGVVIDGTFVKRNERTLTHEVGHCFGLPHTFQSSCGNNCSSSGDGMCDTPPSFESTQGCSSTQNTCGNDAVGPDPYGTDVVDQIENYMSYDECQNMFTKDQQNEMESNLNGILSTLNTTANRAATGVADPYLLADCAPVSDFNFGIEFPMNPIEQDPVSICEGDTVVFEDLSWNAVSTIWDWTFVGGTPNSSSLQNPTITYNTSGVYDVSYQASSSGGVGNVITKTNIITVSSLTADYIGPVIDGFENSTQFLNDWIILNQGGLAFEWERTTSAAATGSASVRIRNVFNNDVNTVSLISPSFDLSTSSPSGLKFKQAFASKTNSDNEFFKVSWSTDCGKTWLVKMAFTAGSLSTAPNQSTEFIPTPSQWVEHTIDLFPIDSATNVRFKFEFTSGGGNNIYLDDINIGAFGTVGINDFSNIASFSVYPNPTSSSAQISFNLMEDVNELRIKVRNSLGQVVTNVINGQSFNAGKYTLKIDEERSLSSGIYFIEFNADNNMKVQKLIVQ